MPSDEERASRRRSPALVLLVPLTFGPHVRMQLQTFAIGFTTLERAAYTGLAAVPTRPDLPAGAGD